MDEDDEEEDIDVDDLDDDDFSLRPKRKHRGTRARQNTTSQRRARKTSDEEEEILQDDFSESGSDGDWRDEGKKKLLGRRRRPKGRTRGPAKRRRTSPVEDEEVARTARINSRTGDAVNYFEGDDDSLLDSDEQRVTAGAAEETVDDKTPRVDIVLDYRPSGGAKPRAEGERPYADYHPDHVEFRVKWMNKCHRQCTWETWATLRDMKGHKRVRNYMKKMENTRAFYSTPQAKPEDIEEAWIIVDEYRAQIKTYEAIGRIVADRESSEDGSQTEYLVKWESLSYAESTWEPRSLLTSDADLKAIDAYNDREQSALGSAGRKRLNPFNNRDERPRFKRMSEQPDYLHGGGRTLRDYQLAGLNFLAFSWTKRNNVILADEMGLGKTLQTISFLGWLMYCRNIPGPFLVVVPLSTMPAWEREFARWLPDLNVVAYSGDGKSRELIRKYEFRISNGSTEKFQVLLTTPEMTMVDQDYLKEVRWAMIAVDEAHRLKNETSALHMTLASLRSANRLLITGTPLQNSVRELWALLHFLNPEVFENAEDFERKFSFTALRDPERVSSLHTTLRPYIIRRQKTDVEKSLPKKFYAVLRVGMTSAQQQYYRWLLTKNFAKLNAGGKGRGIGTTSTLRNLVMELKKCCNHPFLFPNYEDTSTPTTVNDLIRASGKMILLDKLLCRLREKGHRVLIFSQMVRMLDILQDYCRMRNFPHQRLDGQVTNEQRQRAVDHFNAPDSNDFVFLLSTRAGGLGINLATADTVCIFDSDWNPQNDLQAESRAHRIGQKKDVKVFRFLSRETVEEDILERAKRKRVLEHLVIHGVEGGDQPEGKDAQMTFKKEELSAILRFGAEKLFEKDKSSGVSAPRQGGTEDGKANGVAPDAPTAQDADQQQKDEKAEEKRVLEVDDIDELLERAPIDEASEVGGAQPSVGDSLLNAFKWADFKTVEEDDDDSDGVADEKEMAKTASNRLIAMDKQAAAAKEKEEQERDKLAKEGDSEFWERVIPGELKEQVMAADDVVLGTRRRKRTKTFSAESPRDGKRRRVTRTSRNMPGKIADSEELSPKEQRSLLRSLRKFGDPRLVSVIARDSGLQDRVEEDLVSVLLEECLEGARMTIREFAKGKTSSRKKDAEEEDPEYESREEHRSNGKEPKGKSSRAVFDVLGEKGVDAADLLKRCEDLQMLRGVLQTFDPDTQFRPRRVIRAPSYDIRWKPQNDAMLLVGVCRHGFGNWLQIAQDKQLNLTDRINVAGNNDCKPGAPDTTKLARRVSTLLKELEKEVRAAPSKKKNSSQEKTVARKGSRRREVKAPQKKISKSRKETSSTRAQSGKASSSKKMKKGKQGDVTRSGARMALKATHMSTLKELLALSSQNSTLDNTEKIRRTKECLLVLGRAIDEQAESSAKVRRDLWRYVHEVCRTNLAEDRLQGIYEKLAGAADAVREEPR